LGPGKYSLTIRLSHLIDHITMESSRSFSCSMSEFLIARASISAAKIKGYNEKGQLCVIAYLGSYYSME